MNERIIKELLVKAGLESPDFPYDEFGVPFELEKFAELIVKEVADFCFNRGKSYNSVLGHFGVKE